MKETTESPLHAEETDQPLTTFPSPEVPDSPPEVRRLTLGQAIDENPIGLFQYRILLICGLAFMADALEINLLYFLSECAGDDFGLSDSQKAGLNGSVFCGILLGAMCWGDFSNRFGRLVTFIISTSLVGFGGFCSGLAPNYEALVVMRTIVGFGVGGVTVPFDLLAEFTPAEYRGRFLIYIEFFWVIGSLYVSGMAWAILNQDGWRTLCFVTAVPIAASVLYGGMVLPESPRWLMMKGKVRQAEEVIRRAATVNGIVMEPFVIVEDEEEAEEESNNHLLLVTEKRLRNISLPLWTVWLMFGFTYYGMVLLIGRIFSKDTDDDTDDGDSCSFNYSEIFINATSETFGIILCAVTIDMPSLGRRKSQSLFYFLAAAFVLMIGLLSMGNVSTAGIYVFAYVGRMMIMAASNVTWAITPELYPTECRSMGHAVSNGWSKIGAFFVSFIIFSSLSNAMIAFILFCMNMVACGAGLLLPETRGMEMGTTAFRGSDESSIELSARNSAGKHKQLDAESMSDTSNKSVDSAECTSDNIEKDKEKLVS